MKYDDVNWQVFNKDNFDLPTNSTYSIAFDKKDNIWISTMGEGVLKYNGKKKVRFKEELCGNSVFNITIRGDDIYFSCWGGISKFDGNIWTDVTKTTNCSFDVVENVVFDKQGHIWINGGKGNPALAKYNGKEWQIFDSKNSPIECRYVSDIYIENDSTLWFGTSGSGLLKLTNNKWTVFNDRNSELPKGWIYKIKPDKNGNLWLGTAKGLIKYNKETFIKINP